MFALWQSARKERAVAGCASCRLGTRAMEMPAEGVSGTRAAPTKPKRNQRRARVQIDKRFAIGRHIKLEATYAERVGLDKTDPDPMLRAAVQKAAMLATLAEDAAAKATRADPKVSLDDVIRLGRMADLAVRRLRLDQRNNTKQATLSSYLAARGGEQQP
jgi:hypothetical protein